MNTARFEDLIARKSKGSLKVYLGYAAGVGKTYEMLQEGHRLKKQGMDVVIGYVEPHDRPETTALIAGLEEVSRKYFSLGGKDLPEMDVLAIQKRHPQIVLIDELAHTNLRGGKNEKRYEDIFDILEEGINVITTLNVQHLESVAEKVTQVTHAPVQERIPDQILRRSDQVVVVDVTLEELRERLRMGKIYQAGKAEVALQNFFTHENLSFLREICLREVAGDQLRKIEQQAMHNKNVSELADESVMVALSSDPTHGPILIRKATRLAAQLSSRCYAVYVQKKSESPTYIDSAVQRRLQNNLKLAKNLGAEVVMLQGENVVEILVTFATLHHVKHAVFGKSRRSLFINRIMGSVIQSFLHDSVGVDVHVVTTTGDPVEKERSRLRLGLTRGDGG